MTDQQNFYNMKTKKIGKRKYRVSDLQQQAV